ncbi:hypothetical protein TGRUB_224100 [Toxoplasma gondii RUB]|uniref:Uncharacterized protein n=2 Tax=Toxoplasma gondii TaxID=5811 RepID=A0A086LND0_TOXGO|nr:hypothetical protein TGRUB_224100 [Toxoplasma gondii RUB]KFH13532.1 hypothetical protein TGVAND_224100 [Toxoplasma gondii VAND]
MRTGSGELLQIEQGNGGKQVNWKETKMEKEGGFRRKSRRGSSRGRAHAEFSKKVTFFGFKRQFPARLPCKDQDTRILVPPC